MCVYVNILHKTARMDKCEEIFICTASRSGLFGLSSMMSVECGAGAEDSSLEAPQEISVRGKS